MVAVLRGWSREFDAEHPDDTATLLDVFDVVNTARLVLMREMREMGLQFEEDAARQPESPAEAEE